MHTYCDSFNADFTCQHCGRFVPANSAVSGVVNRNHCPYCLHSRHVDLFQAGDRLCACKALMAPVGLSLKKSRDKYAPGQRGELMLVHRCTHCGDLSINRIAADDEPVGLMEIFEDSLNCGESLKGACLMSEIHLLSGGDAAAVRSRLFGRILAAGPVSGQPESRWQAV